MSRIGKRLREDGLWTSLLLATLWLAITGGAEGAEPVVFVDWSWDSGQVHNRIAGFIIQRGYGLPVDYIFADTVPGLLALRRGNAQVSMEMWIENYREIYYDALNAGEIIDLGPNFPDSPQGWYVPTYMIEGDPARGIEPIAPDLRSVADLPRYWDLFEDPEVPGKGRFYNCPTGWMCHDINRQKLKAYGLEEHFTAFDPGSDAALVASLAAAYQRGLPWLGYYWEPTWVMGLYDMTMLQEPAFSEDCWESDMGCAYPPSQVRIAVHKSLPQRAPEVVEFLKAYQTTLEQNNQVLGQMQAYGWSAEEAALWFLREHLEVWSQWVPEAVAQRVQQALRSE